MLVAEAVQILLDKYCCNEIANFKFGDRNILFPKKSSGIRGRVLPIGGLKEKTLAAKNAGIRTVCVPGKNEKDIEELSAEIKKDLEIVYADTIEDILKVAFVKE